MQIQIPLTSNSQEKTIAGNELLVNVYPRPTQGKYPFRLVSAPSLAFFSELPTNPVLALHCVNNNLYAITPSKIYLVYSNGEYKELGDVHFYGRVSVADNGIQIVIVDGRKGFYLDLESNTVEEIVAEGFYPSSHVTYQDGYFIFNRLGTGQFFLSKLLTVDFDPLDFATAEGQSDNIVGLISDHRELLLFGEQTIEIWYNSGSRLFPFERNQGAFIEKGCSAPYSITKLDNTIYFVGNDLIVYQMSGYTPIRVSNHAVENSLKNTDLSDTHAFAYIQNGQKFYVLTIPTQNITWCFDISTNVWHQRSSYNLGRFQANCSAAFRSKILVGDFQNNRIYELSSDCYTDDNQPVVREFTLPTISNGRNYLTIDSFELDMSAGINKPLPQNRLPVACLKISKDNGKTWLNEKFADVGCIGEYLTRVKWNRLGAARQFILKVSISDPIPLDIGGAWIEVR